MLKKSLSLACLALIFASAYPAFAEEPAVAEEYTLVLTPSLTGGLVLPLGAFLDITDIGGGAEIGVQLRNVFFPNATLKLLAGYNFVAEHLATVDSFGVSSLTLLAGYAFPLSDAFLLTPLVGFGYVGHVVSATETSLYLDPQLRLQVDLALNLAPGFSLYASPFFTMFFEQSNVGLYAGLNLGAALSFTIPLRSAPATRIDSILLSRDLSAFSPNADGIKDVVTLTPTPVGTFERFELKILDANKRIVKMVKGGAALPRDWEWDGKQDDGKTAPDGSYGAEITLFGSNGEKTAAAEPFLLDTIGLEATLAVSPKRFSPDGDGAEDTALISLGLKNPEDLNDWSLKILDPSGALFLERRETDGRTTAFAWNGKSAAGETVQSASEYAVEVTAFDRAGNPTILKGAVGTDILIQRFGNRMKVIIPSIVFNGFNADFRQGNPEQVAKNLEILDRLAEIFKKFPGYNLVVEGFAVNVYDDPARMEKENREALIPLSQKRAESIRLALIERGFPSARIKAGGKGNADPVVPYTDKANQWKNRRVEFILEK
jgi:outer membrane protein OmpA-like peptidoglycan-associated protein